MYFNFANYDEDVLYIAIRKLAIACLFRGEIPAMTFAIDLNKIWTTRLRFGIG